jgi:predicted regulator of Ras-like GTPase activity (Roadblock/LC7/MglB family)
MLHRLLGAVHAALFTLGRRLRESAGQGTVEYVALILLVAGVLAAVIVAGQGLKGGGIAQIVVEKLKSAIEGVGRGK